MGLGLGLGLGTGPEQRAEELEHAHRARADRRWVERAPVAVERVELRRVGRAHEEGERLGVQLRAQVVEGLAVRPAHILRPLALEGHLEGLGLGLG